MLIIFKLIYSSIKWLLKFIILYNQVFIETLFVILSTYWARSIYNILIRLTLIWIKGSMLYIHWIIAFFKVLLLIAQIRILMNINFTLKMLFFFLFFLFFKWFLYWNILDFYYCFMIFSLQTVVIGIISEVDWLSSFLFLLWRMMMLNWRCIMIFLLRFFFQWLIELLDLNLFLLLMFLLFFFFLFFLFLIWIEVKPS
jgi:hypothetical protein